MKKNLLKKAVIAATLLLAFIPAATINAADVKLYLSGPFNSWATDDAAWELQETAEGSNVYTGKFTIPASQFLLFQFVTGAGTEIGLAAEGTGYFATAEFSAQGLLAADMVKSGRRIKFDNWTADKEVEFYINIADNAMNMGAKISAPAPEKLYMVGAPTSWTSTPEAVLERVGSTSVYKGQIDVPSGFNRFRFYASEWNNTMEANYNALGTLNDASDVTALEIGDESVTVPVFPGTGMWDIPQWRGGKLNFSLDYAKMSLSVTDPVTGLEVAVAVAPTDVKAIDGGILVTADKDAVIAVYTPAGALVKTVAVAAGETVVALPAGLYIVNGQKVAVR